MNRLILASLGIILSGTIISQEDFSVSKNQESIILGGGCFWCIEAVFESLNGVQEVISGYAGGSVINPTYKKVCSGKTGHAEVVKVVFDKSQISLRQILYVFFSSHNPTTKDGQGVDIGSQYRSIIIYKNEEQLNEINVVIHLLKSQYQNPIITEIIQTPIFYPAEVTHQDYYINNKYNRYCNSVIKPKVNSIKEKFEWVIK